MNAAVLVEDGSAAEPAAEVALVESIASIAPAARRGSAVALGIAILAVIAVVGALYLARAFFVPLLIGILASYALRPFVDRLHDWRVPRAGGAAIVVGALVAALAWATMSLGDDAAAMIEKLPEAARKVRALWISHFIRGSE